jgi:pyruvate kinase
VDCILLGAETVRGTFPVEAARTVLAIAKEAEVVYNNGYQFKKMLKELPTPMPRQMAIASSAVSPF